VSIFPFLGLPPRAYADRRRRRLWGRRFLKAGLAGAQAITTVSPGYAREISRTGLRHVHGRLIRVSRDDVPAFSTGIDPKILNPQSDAALAARYDSPRPRYAGRANNRAIESVSGLTPGVWTRCFYGHQPGVLAEGMGRPGRTTRHPGCAGWPASCWGRARWL